MNQDLSVDVKIFWEACDQEEQGNIEEAIKLYKEAIKLGSSASCINLANYYIENGTDDQIVEAVILYAMASDMEDGGGAWNIYNHFKGSNKIISNYWLKRAADLGDEDAQDMIS